jgi:hypothetical protein
MRFKATALAGVLTVGLSSLAAAQMSGPSPVMSEAQVTRQLEAEGYSNIKLTPFEPNRADPQPQLNQESSGSSLQGEAAHLGWNGTATKDGRTVNIYVSSSGIVRDRP